MDAETIRQKLIKRYTDASARHDKATLHNNREATWYAEAEIDTLESVYQLLFNETLIAE